LILRKIIENVATRCHILKLKCSKFDFGWGFALDPAYSPPPDLVGFKGPTSKAMGRKGKKERGREYGKGEKGKDGMGRKGEGEGENCDIVVRTPKECNSRRNTRFEIYNSSKLVQRFGP